ncbi:MAG TPA: methyltransferase domain-containing protein [Anaerolineae bacterium]|nr:methyltransferase domain-containing protein [Anaerolineae bacterium]
MRFTGALHRMCRRLIRFAFQLLYNQLAFTYDAVAWLVSFGQWRAWGRTALDRVRGPRVLELGHGPGHLLIALGRAGRCQPIGVDVSPHMIAQAQHRVRRAGLSIPQVRCRVEALPFRSGTFDSAVSTFPTEYIANPRTLAEVVRVTNEHGRLIVVMGAQFGQHTPGTRFVDWLYRITGRREPSVEAEPDVFERLNLTAHVETEVVGASTVTIVVAEKTTPDNTVAAAPD